MCYTLCEEENVTATIFVLESLYAVIWQVTEEYRSWM